MENKINIAELLKNVPKGTKLYSPLCGECELAEVGYGCIALKDTDGLLMHFFEEGNYRRNGECMIFPSKENRDWSTFKRPFKDGDILVHTQNQRFIMSIYHKRIAESIIKTHCILWDKDEGLSINMNICCYPDNTRLATEEEKEKLFQVINDNGYKWNNVTKTLEKLVKPNFKVGNKITNGDNTITIKEITLNHYVDEHNRNWSISKQDEWELIPDKFDISTLKPFDKVLVRRNVYGKWLIDFFGFYITGNYHTVGGSIFEQCIPYESNEHLLGTTNDCKNFYKTWEL